MTHHLKYFDACVLIRSSTRFRFGIEGVRIGHRYYDFFLLQFRSQKPLIYNPKADIYY